MATEAQIHANRANAQKSTGPRMPEGKAVVSQNAVMHGFLARETVIQGEDPGEFEFYRDRMLGELAPAGDAEIEMAQRAVGLAWRLRRAQPLQTEAFDALYEKMATGSAAQRVPEPAPDAAGAPGSATTGSLAGCWWRTSPMRGFWTDCWCMSGGSKAACTGPCASCGSKGGCESHSGWRSAAACATR